MENTLKFNEKFLKDLLRKKYSNAEINTVTLMGCLAEIFRETGWFTKDTKKTQLAIVEIIIQGIINGEIVFYSPCCIGFKIDNVSGRYTLKLFQGIDEITPNSVKKNTFFINQVVSVLKKYFQNLKFKTIFVLSSQTYFGVLPLFCAVPFSWQKKLKLK